MELATQFFEMLLQKEVGSAHARLYLHKRSLAPDLQKTFRLGYAANSRNRLKEFLLAKGISNRQLEESGLLVTGNDIAVPYDRFRDRIMFPIENAHGRIVGFGGRALSSDVRAKYLNSPETDLFHKRSVLYNFYRARRISQQKGSKCKSARPLVVVEGYMDVISLTGAGFQEVVAPLGTILTENQINLLWHFSRKPILCFDGDDAGRNAAFRALDRSLPLIKTGVSLDFILLPNGKDPDSIIREGGAQPFRELLGQAVPLNEMLWQRETGGRSFVTPESRAALEKRLRDAAFTIKDGNLRYYYLQNIRERIRAFFRSSFPSLVCREERTNQYRDKLRFSESLTNSTLVKNQWDAIPPREAAILAILVNHPGLWNENFEALATLEFKNQELADLYHTILDILVEWPSDDADTMFNLLIQKGKKVILDQIMRFIRNAGMRSAFASAPLEDARESLKQALCLNQRARYLQKKLRDMETELLKNPNTNISVMLDNAKNELERTSATEAQIDGFGEYGS